MWKWLLKHTDNRGLTIVELLVAMAISAILLVGMAAASTFLQRYISTWRNRSEFREELSNALATVSRHIEQGRSMRLSKRRVDIESANGTCTAIEWSGGKLVVDGTTITAASFRIDSLGITKWALLKQPSDTILSTASSQSAPGIYRIEIIGSCGKKQTDTLSNMVRCNYEYFKNAL